MAVITISNPKPTRNQNTVRQVPPSVSTAPPRTGATIGASPPRAIMIDITLASRSPLATSTTTARATTAARPPPKPWMTRNAIKNQIDGAKAQPMAPSGAEQPADDHRHPPATLVRQRATEQLPQRHAEEERGQGQADQRRRGDQVGSDLRKGRGVHVGRERRHRALQRQRHNQQRASPWPCRPPRPADALVENGDATSRRELSSQHPPRSAEHL